MTWIVFEAEHPGRYSLGAYGEFESGRPVDVSGEVAARLLGPRGHPGFRLAREDEIPPLESGPERTVRPVGQAAQRLARLGQRLRERAETVAACDAEEEHP